MISFEKRESPVQNIALMSLMAAINVVFVLLTTFVPVLVVLIIFVLPMTSVLVTMYCKKAFFPLYAICTIGICMLVTIWNISDTLFFVIPGIISGFLFGLLIEKGWPPIFMIVLPAFVNMAFSFLAIPVVKFIYQADIITTFATAFGLAGFQYLDDIVPSVIFVLSLIQSIFSYMIISGELPKFKVVIKENASFYWFIAVFDGVSFAVMLVAAFFSIPAAMLFMMVGIFFSVYLIFDSFLQKKIWVYVVDGVSLVFTFLLFGLAYSKIEGTGGILLISAFFVLASLAAIINYSLCKRARKDRMSS